MGQTSRIVIVALLAFTALSSPAFAQTDPPSRVARLAFTEGTVSFHDDERSDWTRAVVNTPITSGDSIWTEAGARSEISLAGTRVRLDGGTQLDMLAVDDSQTRVQLAQGRIDVKTFTLDTNQPYQIVTPRGTVSLQQAGDYYIEAGSTQDATRLGVRSGAATLRSVNGQTLAVRAGEVGELYGDAATPQLRTVRTAPPPQPAYWSTRDRQVVYDTPQYVNAGMTGYEDLSAYGSWDNDSEYGRVWYPRSTPANWAPYRTGQWQYVKPWGWTWVDEQPWGFAPYHYGRWANRNNRWAWVPPEREARPVYAPALVAFIGGLELALTLGQQNRAPVGWFPLAPREAYVPSYTANRAYYDQVNRSNRIEEAMLEDRWQRAQRREAIADQRADQQRFLLANQRFATVIPADDFVRSRSVARAQIQVAPEQLATAPVSRVSAPPAPTQSVTAAPPPAANAPAATPATPPATRTADPKAADPKAPDPKAADPKLQAEAATKVPAAQTQVGGMTVLGKPTETERPKAPGPKVATAPAGATTATPPARDAQGNVAPGAAPQGRPTVPPVLQPRVGTAPPKLDDKAPVTQGPSTQGAQPPAVAAPASPATPATPATPAVPNRAQQPATATPATPADRKSVV